MSEEGWAVEDFDEGDLGAMQESVTEVYEAYEVADDDGSDDGGDEE